MTYSAVLIAAVIISTTVACSSGDSKKQPQAPQSQKNLSELAAKNHTALEAAQNTENEIAKKEAERQALAVAEKDLKGRTFIADNWVAKVKNVREINKYPEVIAEFENQTYTLRIPEKTMKSWVSTLIIGETIIFSGNLGTERSVSTSGAARNPEFKFFPTSVKRISDPIYFTQSPTVIAEAEAIEKIEEHNELIRLVVVKHCEKAITDRATVKRSVDFSIIHLTVGQLDKSTWVYRNNVDSQNAFGTKYTDKIQCIAKTRVTEGGVEQIKIESVAKLN